ncbi:uncharacterized protein [Blastocystis hominis]|uniref:Uncharacterized protein n=1 Tax=Blastocystis hominis TaxID=12968 RepID=D8M7E7_BLAHO|nr:uncharacterized protein [Blastocystis hominis]CBK23986.2 unnamed protein product [Blastocystis hominis]|eukprot:XP_012898034.1 uncharacterized protein [Blastocystis hominis]
MVEIVETLVVNGEIVAVEGETDSLIGETVETVVVKGETDSFIGETDSFIGETDSFIGETDSFIGETDSFIGEMVSRMDSRAAGDIPSMALSSFMSAVFRCGPLTGDSSSSELSEREPVDATDDIRDERRTRGGDGSESNWAK